MKFHFPVCGNPTTTAKWASHGTSQGSWQDSHRQRMEYNVKHINYIVTVPGSRTQSLVQLLVFPLCNDLLQILTDNSFQKLTLYTVASVYTFSKELRRRICLTIKNWKCINPPPEQKSTLAVSGINHRLKRAPQVGEGSLKHCFKTSLGTKQLTSPKRSCIMLNCKLAGPAAFQNHGKQTLAIEMVAFICQASI